MNKALIAVIVAVVVVAGAFYFWKAGTVSAPSTSMNQDQIAPVSSSDDISALEADLSAKSSGPDLSGLDDVK